MPAALAQPSAYPCRYGSGNPERLTFGGGGSTSRAVGGVAGGAGGAEGAAGGAGLGEVVAQAERSAASAAASTSERAFKSSVCEDVT